MPFGILLVLLQLPPKSRWGDGGSWLNVIQLRVEYAWRSDRMHVAAWELRIMSGSPLCRGLTRTIYILLHRASENVVSQPGMEPGTSCTAGEYSMKKPFERPYLVAIRDLAATLFYKMSRKPVSKIPIFVDLPSEWRKPCYKWQDKSFLDSTFSKSPLNFLHSRKQLVTPPPPNSLSPAPSQVPRPPTKTLCQH
jgi:hypothetical protein